MITYFDRMTGIPVANEDDALNELFNLIGEFDYTDPHFIDFELADSLFNYFSSFLGDKGVMDYLRPAYLQRVSHTAQLVGDYELAVRKKYEKIKFEEHLLEVGKKKIGVILADIGQDYISLGKMMRYIPSMDRHFEDVSYVLGKRYLEQSKKWLDNSNPEFLERVRKSEEFALTLINERGLHEIYNNTSITPPGNSKL
jgi:hypothetical protein